MKKTNRVVVMILLVCMGVVGVTGCAKKDYGIFTQNGYDMLTDTARIDIESIYNNEKLRVELIKNGDYEGAKELGVEETPSTANGVIIASAIYDATINCTDKDMDLESAFDLKGDAITNLLEYFVKDAVAEVQLSREDITNMKDYLDGLE